MKAEHQTHRVFHCAVKNRKVILATFLVPIEPNVQIRVRIVVFPILKQAAEMGGEDFAPLAMPLYPFQKLFFQPAFIVQPAKTAPRVSPRERPASI